VAHPDAVVVGSGPNGLAAAIVLARAGLAVQVFEGQTTLGGGLQSAPLTLPGFVHDLCAAVFPMAVVSPFLRELPLAKHGVSWLYPAVSLAHPFPDRPAAILAPSLERTLESLGRDASSYRRVFAPLLAQADSLWPDLLAPLHVPRRPLPFLRFGQHAARSAAGFARAHFEDDRVRALFAGCAAHAFLPLTKPLTAALGVVLALTAHSPGWPYAAGGAGRIADALVAYARSLGVTFVTEQWVDDVGRLPSARAYLFDVAPLHLARIAAVRLPSRYRERLRRYRYGPGAFKIDWALSQPIPWRDAACREASTVHVAGTFEDVVRAEADVSAGRLPEKPFILVAQPSLLDPTRAPAGRHTCWAYAHVPHGWTGDATALIEQRLEQFAPGFRDTILARAVTPPAALEQRNPNCIGGHIVGGVADLGQLFTRPVARRVPYSTPEPSIFICSASTPPGAGIHGMCGYHCATTVLARRFA
jgi:phytoene dehydrogenase-like protein